VEAIVIESEVNIQDGVIIHALGGSPVHIGSGVSLAHGAVIHGPCHVENNCFVGFKSVVFKARIGDGVVIQHQALVEGVEIPDRMHVPSMAGVLTDADVQALKPVTAEKVRKTNVFLAEVA
jgi:carbonic anhydrase/acetyltransferase-like protein (isoleucine patch superfamily)